MGLGEKNWDLGEARLLLSHRARLPNFCRLINPDTTSAKRRAPSLPRHQHSEGSRQEAGKVLVQGGSFLDQEETRPPTPI